MLDQSAVKDVVQLYQTVHSRHLGCPHSNLNSAVLIGTDHSVSWKSNVWNWRHRPAKMGPFLTLMVGPVTLNPMPHKYVFATSVTLTHSNLNSAVLIGTDHSVSWQTNVWNWRHRPSNSKTQKNIFGHFEVWYPWPVKTPPLYRPDHQTQKLKK